MPKSPDRLKVQQTPTTPPRFCGGWRDVIEVTHPDGTLTKHPGVLLSPTPPGERATHYPDVLNGLGGHGFHIEASELLPGARLPDGAELPRLEVALRQASARIDLQMIEAETVEGERLFISREFLEAMLALLDAAKEPAGRA